MDEGLPKDRETTKRDGRGELTESGRPHVFA